MFITLEFLKTNHCDCLHKSSYLFLCNYIDGDW